MTITHLKKRILFIINPISGGKSKSHIPGIIRKELDHGLFDMEWAYTQYVGHARELAQSAVQEGVDVVVSVGGDGTNNEIASAVVGTKMVMGLIPMGSGNGLGTALQIPFNPAGAIKLINKFHHTLMDSATINGHPMFNVSGIGFDARIGARFAKSKTRGLWGYVRHTFAELAHYRPEWYKITFDGQEYRRQAFMISLANSSQFGNNAHISPEASVTDGLLDVCVVKPFPFYLFPLLAYRMFSKTAHRSKFLEIFKVKEVHIERDMPGPVHLDGEPVELGTDLYISISPASLHMIVKHDVEKE